MRALVERTIEDGHVVRHAPARRSGRRVSVNDAESPLAWLRARRLVDARQFEAGERLRDDYEMAALGPRVTMRWDAASMAPPGGAPSAGLDPTEAQIPAQRRFPPGLGTGVCRGSG